MQTRLDEFCAYRSHMNERIAQLDHTRLMFFSAMRNHSMLAALRVLQSFGLRKENQR